MADYVALYPTNIAIDERLKKFIEAFYAVSDDPDRNEEWVGFYARDADVVIGDKRARGEGEIRKLRLGMWEKVKSRKHRLEKVFPATFEKRNTNQDSQFEYMLCGTVSYELRNGDRASAQWAGHAIIVNEGGLKLGSYDVYIRG